MDVFQILGDALNGVFQVICDFLNLLASIIPNPDPFPAMIQQIPDDASLSFWGFAAYWIDNAIGVQFMRDAITLWFTAMIAGMVFAVIYWGVKVLKP